MYIPAAYRNTDEHAAWELASRYPFAALISCSGRSLHCTHVPLIPHQGKLVSHVAAANAQGELQDGSEVLAVFNGGHAYIPPALSHYTQVPTWNYRLVHMQGHYKRVRDYQEVLQLMRVMITHLDAEYLEHFNRLPEAATLAMSKELVAFEIEVRQVQLAEKLSQDKPKAIQHTVASHLEHTQAATGAGDLSLRMRELLGR